MTIPGTCEVARKAEPCAFCHVEPGCPCHDTRPGTHLCRIALAAHDGLITQLDFVSVIPDGAFAGWTLIPEVAA